MPAVWGEITAEEILSPISGTFIAGYPKTVFSGFSTDSRRICAGDLFFALMGERFDGHEFVDDAVTGGAAGVVVQGNRVRAEWKNQGVGIGVPVVLAVEDTQRALGDLAGWWRHQYRTRVVAITGSAGKTTTKEMLAGILALDRGTLKNEGNLNNLIGLPLSLLRLNEGHEEVVLEMGMNHPGEIGRLTEIADPDVGVITNVGEAHLEGVGDLQGVARAKIELVERISPESIVVINGDNPGLLKAAALYGKKIMAFGMRDENDVRAGSVLNLGKEGVSFMVQYEGGSFRVILRSPGLQNVWNALAAATASLSMDVTPERIAKGLEHFTGLRGRYRLIHLKGNIGLVDDTYNSNPLSLKAALESMTSLREGDGRIFVGLGEMLELGKATVPAHREAGRLVACLRPYRFLALGKHAREMIRGALDGGMLPEDALEVESHIEMFGRIMAEMRQGDLILLKGSRKMGLDKVIKRFEKLEDEEWSYGSPKKDTGG